MSVWIAGLIALAAVTATYFSVSGRICATEVVVGWPAVWRGTTPNWIARSPKCGMSFGRCVLRTRCTVAGCPRRPPTSDQTAISRSPATHRLTRNPRRSVKTSLFGRESMS